MNDFERMLEQRFIDNEKLSTAQHQNIVDKIQNLEKNLTPRISALETTSEEWKSYKSYIIMIVALISFGVPIALAIVF